MKNDHKQRTLIGVVINEPDLDFYSKTLYYIQKEIFALLNELRWKEGADLSILFICHDVALVQSFCDRLIVMYQGRIVEEGTPDDVIKSPRDPYTKRLIESIFQ